MNDALRLAAAPLSLLFVSLAPLYGGTPPASADLTSRLPLEFEENRGQFDSRVEFFTRAGDLDVFLTRRDAVVSVRTDAQHRHAFRITMTGGAPERNPKGMEKLPGTANYFFGSSASEWRTSIPNYRKVLYEEIWPGIDLVYYGNQRQVEFDFNVAPGADFRRIQLSFSGVGNLRIGGNGDLVFSAGGKEVRQRRPEIYQMIAGARRPVQGGYTLRGRNQVAFIVGEHDRRKPLVIDPVLAYATYAGGSGLDLGSSVAVDAGGNAYITGYTDSPNFPVSEGAFSTSGPREQVFVTKINPDATARIYSTLIGGSGDERGRSIAVDGGGNAYITGATGSSDFPATGGAFQRTYRGPTDDGDAFVVKLNPQGAALVYSTYLGGTGIDSGWGIAVDSGGNAVISGNTSARDFPSGQTYAGGEFDAFVAKVNADGSGLQWSTLLGGSARDVTNSVVAMDAFGNAYVTGETSSSDFPTTDGVLRREYVGGDTDAFVAKFSSSGASPVFSTYLGGRGAEIGNGIAADGFGNVYVAGATSSPDFPRTAGTSEFRGGERDGFLTRLNPNGSEVQFSTLIGGGGGDDLFGVVLGPSGLVSLVGSTTSTNLPVTSDAIQSTAGGEIDVFLAQVDTSSPGAVRYMTYLGGSGLDDGFALAADAMGSVYLTGAVDPGFPVTPGAGQTVFGGGNGDAFLAKIAPDTGGVQPRFTAEGVTNAATFQGGPVAPGELVTIFGTDIGPAQLVGLELNEQGFVRDTLGATRVLFDGVAAPLVYASQTQTTAIVPYSVAARSTTSVAVVHRGVTSQAVALPVTPTAPGIFTNAASGTGQGAILNQDGSRNLPESPADAGSTVSIYATGGGFTDPPTETGSVPTTLPFPRLALPAQVRIGGIEAEVSYYGVAPGLVSGVIQVNARVPAGAPRGAAVPVELFVGSAGSRSGVTMAIR